MLYIYNNIYTFIVFFIIYYTIMSEWENDVLSNKSTWNPTAEVKQGNTRGNIAEVLQNTADPSKAPLNYINNMNEWKSILESYRQEVREKAKELLSVLELKQDKKLELDKYNEEKVALDIDLKETEWTMYRKLSPYADFIDDVYNRVKTLFKDDSEESESDWRYAIPLQVRHDKDNNKIFVTTNREVTDAEKKQIGWNIMYSFQEAWIDTTDTEIEYIVQPDFDFSSLDKPDKDVLEQYLKLVNPDKFNDVLKMLKFFEKFKLKKIKKELEELVGEYSVLNIQIYNLLQQIEWLEKEYGAWANKSDSIEEEIDKMDIDIEKKAKRYSLNSYLSTKKVSLDDFVAAPTVEKQIKYILELHKRWLPMPKTVLLYWWYNLWKTYAANVLATELNRKMYHIKSCDIKNSEFPDAWAMIDGIFSQAIEEKEPCIIFLDEIEKFSKWLEWSPYQDQIENTIRHHISKIKESSLDIMIIWAISDKSKIDPSLMKQDVFSKQIDFESLWDDRCILLFQKLMKKFNLELWEDVILNDVISKIPEKNPEYIKRFVETIADCHLLNNLDAENCVISQNDIDEAVKIMWAYSRNSSWVPGFK